MKWLVPAVVAMLALVPVGARAQVACGTTIARGEKVTLTGNLGPCDGVPAAVVVDGGSLDLGGFTVTCGDANLDGDVPVGVMVVGKKSKVSNGVVDQCAVGVSLGGDGKHRVVGVTAQRSRADGFEVLPETVQTKLVGVVAASNDVDGIRLRGDRSKIVDAAVTDNGEDGIDVASSAERNKVVRAELLRNAVAGILIDGSRNKLVDPTATDNDVGIDLDGAENTVRGGSAHGNRAYDVADCAGDKVKKLDFTTATPDCR